MSIRVETTYLATCDYPDCHMTYDFWEVTEEDAILEVIDNGEWLCLFAGDNKPRFFCPAHLRYVQNSRHGCSTRTTSLPVAFSAFPKYSAAVVSTPPACRWNPM